MFATLHSHRLSGLLGPAAVQVLPLPAAPLMALCGSTASSLQKATSCSTCQICVAAQVFPDVQKLFSMQTMLHYLHTLTPHVMPLHCHTSLLLAAGGLMAAAHARPEGASGRCRWERQRRRRSPRAPRSQACAAGRARRPPSQSRGRAAGPPAAGLRRPPAPCAPAGSPARQGMQGI